MILFPTQSDQFEPTPLPQFKVDRDPIIVPIHDATAEHKLIVESSTTIRARAFYH